MCDGEEEDDDDNSDTGRELEVAATDEPTETGDDATAGALAASGWLCGLGECELSPLSAMDGDGGNDMDDREDGERVLELEVVELSDGEDEATAA